MKDGIPPSLYGMACFLPHCSFFSFSMLPPHLCRFWNSILSSNPASSVLNKIMSEGRISSTCFWYGSLEYPAIPLLLSHLSSIFSLIKYWNPFDFFFFHTSLLDSSSSVGLQFLIAILRWKAEWPLSFSARRLRHVRLTTALSSLAYTYRQ